MSPSCFVSARHHRLYESAERPLWYLSAGFIVGHTIPILRPPQPIAFGYPYLIHQYLVRQPVQIPPRRNIHHLPK